MKEEVKVFDASEARKVLERVHNYLGILIRESLVKDAPFLKEGELENESDLADDVWEVLQGVPRNCDEYRTADDARAGFIEFCNKYTCGKCRFADKEKPVGCAIEWLYEKAGKNDVR